MYANACAISVRILSIYAEIRPKMFYNTGPRTRMVPSKMPEFETFETCKILTFNI